MTHLRTAQVAVASVALLGFDLAGWMEPDKPEWVAAIAGGDTNTNAAPAGAALGARFGLSAIPNRWRTTPTRSSRGGAPPLSASVAPCRPPTTRKNC